MARGKRKNQETRFPDDLDYLSYNTWSILHSAQWVLKHLYKVVDIHLFLNQKFPEISDRNDAIELFKALEPLRAYATDENRLKRAEVRKHKKEVQ